MIKITKIPYAYEWEGGYTGDVTYTESSYNVLVEIGTLQKTFKNDPYLHKTREWINKTFAEEQASEIYQECVAAKKEIERLKTVIENCEAQTREFLVPVEIEIRKV